MLLLTALLCVGCNNPRKQALRQLNQSGIEPSGRSLVCAVLNHDSMQAGLLLDAGVYTEQRDARGRTPLGIAVENCDLAAVFMLLNAHANVNSTYANHVCILGIALERGDAVLIHTLLEAGARPVGLMPDGEEILPWVIRQGRLDLVKTMMQAGTDPHLKDRHGNPLLHVAMESGRRDLMESLIELGADPGGTNAAGQTTLQLALQQGWVDVLPRLAAAGADPNACGPDGRTLLEQAVDEANPQQVDLLLSIGADPNQRQNPDARPSAMQQVFENPSSTLLEIFLKRGARPPSNDWAPWLWQTLQQRDFPKAQLLLSHGARASSPGPTGMLPVEYATLTGAFNFVKLLLDYGAPPGRSLDLVCARGDHAMVAFLLASGLTPRAPRFPSRDSLLASALRNHQDRVAELLIQYGADTQLSPPEGQSLFLLAIATGCPRAVKLLLEAGANPNASFALPVSSAFLQQVRPGVMRWLLHMDRKVTPLMLAADSGNVHTARYLIKAGAKTQVWTRVAELWPMDLAARRGDVSMMRLFLGQDPYREERYIEIQLSEQRVRVTDAQGKELFTTKISTGRRGFATPTGEFAVTNKHRDWTSTLYHASMPYFLRLSCGDFGLHQGYVPDYPASHGCIRVPAGKAAQLFSITQLGDRVRILP
jgi:ankyrin repeat protein